VSEAWGDRATRTRTQVAAYKLEVTLKAPTKIGLRGGSPVAQRDDGKRVAVAANDVDAVMIHGERDGGHPAARRSCGAAGEGAVVRRLRGRGVAR